MGFVVCCACYAVGWLLLCSRGVWVWLICWLVVFCFLVCGLGFVLVYVLFCLWFWCGGLRVVVCLIVLLGCFVGIVVGFGVLCCWVFVSGLLCLCSVSVGLGYCGYYSWFHVTSFGGLGDL